MTDTTTVQQDYYRRRERKRARQTRRLDAKEIHESGNSMLTRSLNAKIRIRLPFGTSFGRIPTYPGLKFFARIAG
jgi:hypothetical protein